MEIGALDLQLSEIPNSIRARTIRDSNGRTEPKDLTTQSLEDLQKNIVSLQSLSNTLHQKLQETNTKADQYAFKIYFIKAKKTVTE